MDMNKFLALKALEKEKVDFEMSYVDMAGGDLIAGLLLSQIIYWFSPDKNGKLRTRVTYKGKRVIAKNRDGWYEEVRITPRQYDRSIKILQDLNIVQIKNSMFNGKRTPFIMLNEDVFLSLYEKEISRYYDTVTPILPDSNTDIDETDIPLTETTTETTTRITKNDNGVLPNGKNSTNAFSNPEIVSAISRYMNDLYFQKAGEKHPYLKPEQYKRVYDTLDYFCDDKGVGEDGLVAMMVAFLNSEIDSDWNINHFATEGILMNRFYEELYGR